MSLYLGLSGDKGSFSEEAALLYAQKNKLTPTLAYLIDMDGVLSALEKQDIDLGIFPVVNLQGGLVVQAFAAMGKHLFTPIDEIWLLVNQCLLVYPGTTQITQIVSHPQGLAQCQGYLQKQFKDLPQIPWCDTAKAAKDLAEGHFSTSTAVIAPKACAKLYGLTLLAENIQDNKNNLTAFIVVKPRSANAQD